MPDLMKPIGALARLSDHLDAAAEARDELRDLLAPRDLPCRVVLEWRGKVVLDGQATAVVAYDVALAHLRGHFAGVDFRLWEAEHITGRNLLGGLLQGEAFVLEYRDATGAARASVTRV